MAAVTIHSDFGAHERKMCYCFFFFPFYLPWKDGTGGQDLVFFFMLSFKPDFSLSCFTLIKRIFTSSPLSIIRVILSVYLRLLIFLPEVLIPACDSSSLVFFMVCSAYKLNKKQSDNIQPYYTPFPVLNQNNSVVPCPVLTVASWPAYRFLRRHVKWSSIPMSLRIFHSLLWST